MSEIAYIRFFCSNLTVQSLFASAISFESMFPSSSPAMKTFNRLGEQFGEGSLTPYRLIFDGKLMNKKVDTKEGFDVMQSVIYALTKHEAYDDNSEIDDNSEDVNVSLLSKHHCDISFIAKKYMSHDFDTNKMEWLMIPILLSLFLLHVYHFVQKESRSHHSWKIVSTFQHQ